MNKKQQDIKKIIKTTLVEFYKKCSTDKWGQVHRSNFQEGFFGEKDADVQTFCQANKGILQYGTYGGSFGTYTAFTIEDKEIYKSCSEALRTNPNYLRNVNNPF